MKPRCFVQDWQSFNEKTLYISAPWCLIWYLGEVAKVRALVLEAFCDEAAPKAPGELRKWLKWDSKTSKIHETSTAKH